MPTVPLPPYPSHAAFLFGAPLYARYALPPYEILRGLLFESTRIDGHCVHCGRESTFIPDSLSGMTYWPGQSVLPEFIPELRLHCLRVGDHTIRFHIQQDGAAIQKVGQMPALADIANDQSRAYRTVLRKDDAAEFHRAIGLASHGVGIGAFVYLRRIFERLIRQRFEDFRDAEEWTEEAFRSLRMNEKIDLLNNHLPRFLVENSKMYGILSAGLHELTEDECLAFFEVLKASTVMILEEDKLKKEELARRASLGEAIARFSARKS